MNNPPHRPRFRFWGVIHDPLETVSLFTVNPVSAIVLSLQKPLVPNSHAPVSHDPALHALSLQISEQPKAPKRHIQYRRNSIDLPGTFRWGFISRD